MTRVLVLRCGQPPVIEQIEASLESMQAIVGGLIEYVALPDSVALICNEEGKCGGYKANRLLRHLETGRVVDVLAGDAFIVRICDENGDEEDGGYADLTDADIAHWSKHFEHPLPDDFPVPEPGAFFLADR